MPKVVPILAANLKRDRGRGVPAQAARISMSAEQQIKQAHRRIRHPDVMMDEVIQLDGIAAQLMTVQRHWRDSNRAENLTAALSASRAVWQNIQDALADGSMTRPPDVQH